MTSCRRCKRQPPTRRTSRAARCTPQHIYMHTYVIIYIHIYIYIYMHIYIYIYRERERERERHRDRETGKERERGRNREEIERQRERQPPTRRTSRAARCTPQCIYIHMNMFVCINSFIFICMYIHIYIYRERERQPPTRRTSPAARCTPQYIYLYMYLDPVHVDIIIHIYIYNVVCIYVYSC